MTRTSLTISDGVCTTGHYAAIHYPQSETIRPAVQCQDIPPPSDQPQWYVSYENLIFNFS